MKDIITASPNLFVSDGMLGGLNRLFESLVTIPSSDEHDGSSLSLRESLVKFVLEEELNWLVGDPPRKVSALPEKLLLEKNERLFIDLWPDIKRYCSEVAIKTWEFVFLTSQDPEGEGPSWKQMFERARLSEELSKCSYQDYVDKVAAEFENLKKANLIEGNCELQGDKANKSKYLQSSSVLNLSEGPANCSASHTLKKLCMIPHLSLAAMNNQMTTLLANCTGAEKRECFRLAAERGNIRMVECLLNAGVPVEDRSDPISPICMAALCERWEVVGKLMNEGANANVAVADGYTAFGLLVSSEEGSRDLYYRCAIPEIKHRMNDNMSIVGLLINRLIKNVEEKKPIFMSQRAMLKEMIKRAPETFLEMENTLEGRPITRLFRCNAPELDSLKLQLLAPGFMDWGADPSQTDSGPYPPGSNSSEYYRSAKRQRTVDGATPRVVTTDKMLTDKVSECDDSDLTDVFFKEVERLEASHKQPRTEGSPAQPEIQKIVIKDPQGQRTSAGRGTGQTQDRRERAFAVIMRLIAQRFQSPIASRASEQPESQREKLANDTWRQKIAQRISAKYTAGSDHLSQEQRENILQNVRNQIEQHLTSSAGGPTMSASQIKQLRFFVRQLDRTNPQQPTQSGDGGSRTNSQPARISGANRGPGGSRPSGEGGANSGSRESQC